MTTRTGHSEKSEGDARHSAAQTPARGCPQRCRNLYPLGKEKPWGPGPPAASRMWGLARPPASVEGEKWGLGEAAFLKLGTCLSVVLLKFIRIYFSHTCVSTCGCCPLPAGFWPVLPSEGNYKGLSCSHCLFALLISVWGACSGCLTAELGCLPAPCFLGCRRSGLLRLQVPPSSRTEAEGHF